MTCANQQAIEAELLATFRGLRTSLAKLHTALVADGGSRHWVSLAGKSLETLAGHCVAITYGETELTHTEPGLIGVRPPTLALAETVNTLKTRLTHQVLALRTAYGAGGARTRALALLRAEGAPRVSLRQAYRHLLVLDAAPERIGFSYARAHRSIRTLTFDAASTLIENIFDDEQDRAQALERLHAHRHRPLYQVYPASAHLRANLVWPDGRRQARLAHSALLYPAAAGDPIPAYRTPNDRAGARAARSDLRIAREPLIAHTPIHLGA